MSVANRLVITDIWKCYSRPTGEQMEVLKGASLDVESGQTQAIMGPSGSGKSTLLHLIGSLDVPSRGSVRLGTVAVETLSGKALAEYRAKSVGFVFQDHHLLPQLNALENVLLPTIAHPIERAKEWSHELLDRVGLGARLGAFPHELSGGERQRVAVARAMIARPSLLLCDEPTGNLDEESGNAIISLLLEVSRDAGTSVVLVTHNPEHASRMARTALLKHGVLEDAT